MSAEYFNHLLHLLNIEREEDLQAYITLSANSSASQRRDAGLTWFPVAIRSTELSRGDYLTVEIERTTHHDLSHQFRFGSSVAFFSNHDPKDHRVEGTITYLSGNTLKVTLRTDELPEWSRNGKLGVDLLFDNNSYSEMYNALKTACSLAGNREEGHLVKILTGDRSPSFIQDFPPQIVSGLNSSQQLAVNKIIAAKELAIVHGPPGTGKTTTLVQAIKALYNHDHQQILVVAPSNTAVDLLTEKLTGEGLNVLRVGNPERVSERLISSTLDSKMGEHSSMKDVKRLKKQAAEYRKMAHKYKRHYGKAEQDQRKALFSEAHKIMKEVDRTEQYIMDALLTQAEVITATLVGSNHYTVRNFKYHTVVIDEAGQALEPSCWIPILKATKVVLAGDHCQLPPTIKSSMAAREGLSTTLLEKCTALHPESVVLLDEQYRMNASIMRYSSKVFYQNKLKAHPSVAAHLIYAMDLPFTFIDTAGTGFAERSEGTSTINPDEAQFLINHLLNLTNEINQNSSNEDFPNIAIISPYKEQINIMKGILLTVKELEPYHHQITVNTIDSFQGQEKDIVYVSMTRSNSKASIGFLSDLRRMNVAITRARKKLVIIGDSATISHVPFYAQLISYAADLNSYHSVWDYDFFAQGLI